MKKKTRIKFRKRVETILQTQLKYSLFNYDNWLLVNISHSRPILFISTKYHLQKEEYKNRNRVFERIKFALMRVMFLFTHATEIQVY